MRKILTFSLALALALGGLVTLPNSPLTKVSANSAQSYWEGITATGAMITGEDCPIIVKNENLTFNINSFPQTYYSTAEEILAYDNTVTAEYTFFNPADYTVNATLAFPFGFSPWYAQYYTEEGERVTLEEEYTVTLDGEQIENTVRHTFSYEHLPYNNAQDLPKLIDGFVKDDFYSPDLPIYSYGYILECDQRDKNGFFCAKFRWHKSDDVRLILTENFNTKLCHIERKEEYLDIYFRSRTLIEPQITFIGGNTPNEIEWTFCDTYKPTATNFIGTVSKKQNTDFTDFYSLVMQSYSEDNGVSESDWYNAIVYDLNNARDFNIGLVSPIKDNFDVSEYLMRWCYYQMTVEPNQTVVNSVTVPIYPAIDIGYNPPIYRYDYLLSPAQTWASFENLNVEIITPFELVSANGFNFVKSENGFTYSQLTLPEGELSFVLSTESKPREKGCFGGVSPSYLLIPLALASTLYFIIIKKQKTLLND